MTKLVAWSYSRIDGFETCPRQYWHRNVAKDVVEEASDSQNYGKEVHDNFKDFFKRGAKLPLHLRQYEPMLMQIAAAPGQKIVEQQIALDKDFNQCDWFSKDAYVRVISDLTQMHGNHAVTWDWKTGKQKHDFTQLKLNAAVTFHLAPEIEHITMAYYWLKDKKVAAEPIVREQASDVWAELLPRVQRFQDAYAANNFPPRQNYLCKGYCPVKTCQFWEPRRKK